MSSQVKQALDKAEMAILETYSSPMEEEASLTLYDLETGLVEALSALMDAREEYEKYEDLLRKGETESEAVQVRALEAETLLTETESMVLQYLEKSAQKRDAVARYILHLQSKMRAMREEEVRIAKMRKKTETKLDTLKSMVVDILAFLNKPKLEGETYTLRRQRNPASLDIYDETAVPNEYRKKPVPPPPDTQHIVAVLKKHIAQIQSEYEKDTGRKIDPAMLGEALDKLKPDLIPGTRLVTNRYHLRVE